MARVNIAEIQRQLAKNTGLTSKLLKEAAQDRAQVVFNDAVKGLKKAFDEHPVTQEIQGGIASANISNTLVGGLGHAPSNLYSFIGFHAGDPDPTQVIRERLDPKHPNGPKISAGTKAPGNLPIYNFYITFNLEAIYSVAKLPWAKDLSWAEKIESGIENFSHFLPTYNSKKSYSGGGIQLEKEVYNGVSYRPPQNGYLKKMVQDFAGEIKNFKRQKNR